MKSGPGIQTKMLASMARVSEAELVYAIKHTGELYGVKIPQLYRLEAMRRREILIICSVLLLSKNSKRHG